MREEIPTVTLFEAKQTKTNKTFAEYDTIFRSI